MITGVLVVIAPFFGLSCFGGKKILSLCKIEKINSLFFNQQWQHQLRCEIYFWWIQCRFIDERSWTWLKKVHVIVLISSESQHFIQNGKQKCCKLHLGFCALVAISTTQKVDTYRINGMFVHTSNQWDVYTHLKKICNCRIWMIFALVMQRKQI